MLEVQKYLIQQSNELVIKNKLQNLYNQYKILAKQSKIFPNLYLFTYDIDADFSQKIVCECRGLILDSDNNWSIVSRPFDKFFNRGESLAAKLDPKTTTVYEKLDGSLMVLYYYNKEWRVSTSGTPDGDAPLIKMSNNDSTEINTTFAKHFWKVFSDLKYELPKGNIYFQNIDYIRKCSFMFELCTLENKVVIEHKIPRIVFLGARNIESGIEYNPVIIANDEWEVVKTFKFELDNEKSDIDIITQAINSIENINGLQQEGYVYCDRSFNRVKDKSPEYIKAHRAISRTGSKTIVKLILDCEESEIIAYFPDLAEAFDIYKNKFNKLVEIVENQIKEIKQNEFNSQKDLAQFVLTNYKKYSGIILNHLNYNYSVEECIRKHMLFGKAYKLIKEMED